jgi:hypothetical protein
MTVDDSLPVEGGPNLLVSGLVNTTGLVSKIQTLISQLSSNQGFGNVVYKSYSLTYRDGEQAALVPPPSFPGV